MTAIVISSFTAADGTNVTSYSGEQNAAWSAHPFNAANGFIHTNRLTKDNQTTQLLLMASGVIAGEGYVEAPLRLMSALAVNAGIAISLDPANDDYVWVRHNFSSNLYELRSTVASIATNLASAARVLVAGDLKTVRLERRVNGANTEYRVLENGVEIIPWTVSNGHTGTRVGVRFGGAASTTTGYAFESFEAGTTGVAGSVPSDPTGLTLTSLSSRSVMAVWNNGALNEDTCRLERKTGSGGAYAEITFTGKNIRAFYDNTVTSGVTYFYRVKARNSNGDSGYAPEQSITVPLAGSTVAIWTSNLQHGIGTDNVANYTRQLNSYLPSADIVCVQERTDSFNGWASGLAAAGFTEIVYRRNDSPDQDDGSAIWIRNSTVTNPGNQTWQHDLSTGAIGWSGLDVDKSAVAAKLTVGGVTFLLVCTHLAWSAGADSNGSTFSAIRVAQINELFNWINNTIQPGPLDVIITGDMNFGPDYPKNPSGLQIDAFLANHTDCWAFGLGNGKSTAPWGDRDGAGVLDMPVTSLTTRTHDTRRIDYFFLKTGSVNLSLRNITIPDVRVLCPHALSGIVCTPEVQVLANTPDDMGVKPTDHNPTLATFDLSTLSNLPPTCNAGANQNLSAGTTITTLTGTANDPEGDSLTITWSRISGPNTPFIQSPNALITQIQGMIPGVYVFRLTVSDGRNLPVFDDVQVTIAGSNQPPICNAGADQNLPPGTTQTNLNGTASDPEGDTLTRTWSVVSGPNIPSIVNSNLLSTQVQGMISGTYIFRLTVSDGFNAPVSDQVSVTIGVNIGNLNVLPQLWTWKAPITIDKDVLVFKPYYGPSQTRSFGPGDSFHSWEIGDDDADELSYNTMLQFWENHYPGVEFFMYDPQLDETRTYEIDSGFGAMYNHSVSYSWKFRIKESYPYTVTPGAPA